VNCKSKRTTASRTFRAGQGGERAAGGGGCSGAAAVTLRLQNEALPLCSRCVLRRQSPVRVREVWRSSRDDADV
jgi:hypothetical protein